MDQEKISTRPPPSRARSSVDWTRVLVAALGVGSMIAGGLLVATPAGWPLITAGTGLVTWTIPFRLAKK